MQQNSYTDTQCVYTDRRGRCRVLWSATTCFMWPRTSLQAAAILVGKARLRTSSQAAAMLADKGKAENQPAGSHVGSVSAVDLDTPPRDRFVYVIDDVMMTSRGGDFRVDAETGRITTTKPLDRERQELYQVTVTARPTNSANQSTV